ncbi:MAG: hypothetical protein M1840_000943 [Geoglossum simile]|nr:MAG: hypothetical protein M1840_000943 [Geoglossum simile]
MDGFWVGLGFSCLTSDWFPYLCQGTFSPPTTVPYWENGRFANAYTVAEAGSGSAAQAWAVCVKWKTDDLSLFPTAVAATLETSEPSTTSETQLVTTTPTSPKATAGSTKASSATGLPTSTKIVIGVLVPLVLICVLAAIFIYFHRRRWAEPVDSDPGQQLRLDDIQQPPVADKVQGFGDVSPPEAYKTHSPGNALSLPMLPSGADLSMGQERWEPSVEMPVPENRQVGGGLYPGYLRKLHGSGY